MAAPSKILVPNIWNPSSNRYLIMYPSSSESLSAQLSTTMPNGHDASIHLTQRNLRYLSKFIFSDCFFNSRLISFPTVFWWRRRISTTTSLISFYVCFCGTVRCHWGLSSSNMLSRTFWTLRCYSNISGAQFCKYIQQFPEIPWWLQWLPVSWQYLAHVAGVYRDGIAHVLFLCMLG